MKFKLYRIVSSAILSVIVCLSCSFTCSAQNGPTPPVPPSVGLTWTNAPAPTGETLSLNNVYRCTMSGTTPCVPAPPAIFTSTAPITAWKDTTVAVSTSYVYAVTETAASVESAYSNTGTAVVPGALGAPTLGAPAVTGKNTAPEENKDKAAESDGVKIIPECGDDCLLSPRNLVAVVYQSK